MKEKTRIFFYSNRIMHSNFRTELLNNIEYNPTLVMSNIDCNIALLTYFQDKPLKSYFRQTGTDNLYKIKSAKCDMCIDVIVLFAMI